MPKAAAERRQREDAQITKIEAKGEVVITSEDDQTTTSDWAIYDLPAQQVTVGGNVVLTQGKNVLKGDRLVIDLTTGESRFENTGNAATGGRIRALFMPKRRAPRTPNRATPSQATRRPTARRSRSSDPPDGAGASDKTPADSEPSDEVPWPLSPDARP